MFRYPAFYTAKEMFARLKEDGETLVVYNNDRDEWIASNPEVFIFTDHYKDYPMMLISLKDLSKKDLQDLLFISWKMRTTEELLKKI